MNQQSESSAKLGPLPRWDLSDLYPGPDAPELTADLARLADLVNDFAASWQGKLAELDLEWLEAYRPQEQAAAD